MTRNTVPVQFQGLARLFRGRVVQTNLAYVAAVKAITAPLESRLQRKPKLRDGMVIDTVRAFRAISLPYRLALTADTDSKGALIITEWRLGGTEAMNNLWENPEWELGVAICK